MLRVRKPLLIFEQELEKIPTELRPFAAAEIAVRRNCGAITLALEGVILDNSVNELQAFLKDVSCFRATNWNLQMEALRVISTKGLRVLVQFSRVLRGRGHKLTIANIHRQVYTTMQELRLVHEFDWRD
jgi:anti-anti-sigma factor